MSQNLITLLTTAAELRAVGASWEAVGKHVNRTAGTCGRWPTRYAKKWEELYSKAQRDRYEEIGNEGLSIMRRLLRSKEEKLQLKAAEIIMRWGPHRTLEKKVVVGMQLTEEEQIWLGAQRELDVRRKLFNQDHGLPADDDEAFWADLDEQMGIGKPAEEDMSGVVSAPREFEGHGALTQPRSDEEPPHPGPLPRSGGEGERMEEHGVLTQPRSPIVGGVVVGLLLAGALAIGFSAVSGASVESGRECQRGPLFPCPTPVAGRIINISSPPARFVFPADPPRSTMRFSPRHLIAALVALTPLAFCVDETPLSAQPKAVPIVAAPQMPTLAAPTPNGVQRGTSLELTLTGTNLSDAVSVWTSFPAKVTIPTDMNNGKDVAKLRVKLDVPADAPIGFHTIRVATKHGVSNARVFCVDELPQVAEVDTNRVKATAQVVPVPSVVMGRTDAEISDFYKINVKADQRLTFEVLGRRLGSGFDPIILLHDVKSGREMPGLYSDDAPGLQTDARLTHTFKEAGDYIVEIRDTTHRGGADFNYRLRIGDFPAAISALPMAMKRGSKATINFAGQSVDGVAPVELTAPSDPTKSVFYVSPKRPGGLSGWPVPVNLVDYDVIAETEPNNDIAKANKLTVPGAATGRFLEKGDVDYYSFPAKKGTKYIITAETYEVNSPAEVYLILKNAKNAELAKSVPTTPSARVEFTATEDSDLFVHAEHLNYAHGPNEVYHLTVKAAEADFDVNLGIDRFDVIPGGTTLIPVTGIVRRDYTGPIELSVVGHPGLSGTVKIAAGVPPAAPPPAPGTIFAYLPLTAKADVPIGGLEFRVQAKATVNGKDIIRLADVGSVVKAGMAGLTFPPREMLTSLAVGVTDKPVFSLAGKLATPEVFRGTPVNLTITATRAMGFTEDITLTPVGLPANVTVAIKPIGKGTNDIQVQLTAAPAAAIGTFNVSFRGTAKSGGKDFAYVSSPISFTIALPFELKVEPSLISLKPGAKAKVKVTTIRKTGFAGPIDVELKNLPAMVTAPKTPIPMGKNEVEIELTAAPAAAAGDKADVNATGTAGTNTGASPNFTVRVEKADKK